MAQDNMPVMRDRLMVVQCRERMGRAIEGAYKISHVEALKSRYNTQFSGVISMREAWLPVKSL